MGNAHMLRHGTMHLQPPARHRSVHLYVLPSSRALKRGAMKPALGNVSPGERSTATSNRSCCLCRALQEWRERFKAGCTLHLPEDTSHSLQETALCSQRSSAAYKNSKSPKWEEHTKRREQRAACCLLLSVPPATRRQKPLLLHMLRWIHLTATVG